MRYPGRDKEVYDIRTERVVNRKHRRIIKKYYIGRGKVSMCIRRVATITSLKLRITKEDKLRGFG